MALWSLGCDLAFPEPVWEADHLAPAAVEDLALADVAEASVTLTWTAPGDDGRVGTADSLELRFAECVEPDALRAETFADAALVTPGPVPVAGGSRQSFTVAGLRPDRIYCFALRALDGVGNLSPLSNVVRGATLDLQPPGAVTDLVLDRPPAGRRLSLAWTPPGDADLEQVVVLRARGEVAIVPPADGELLAPGDAASGARVVFVGARDSDRFLDEGLTDGQTYTYAVFAMDDARTYGPGVSEPGTPRDLLPPPPIEALRVQDANDGRLELSWRLPRDEQPVGVLVLRQPAVPPALAPPDGHPSPVGTSVGEATVVYVGTHASFVDLGLEQRSSYHYAVHTFDPAFNHAPPERVAGASTPSDGVPPGFVSIQPHPRHVRVGQTVVTTLSATEPIAGVPTLLVGEHPAACEGEQRDFVCRLTAVAEHEHGPKRIQVSGRDLAGNTGVTEGPTLSFDFGPPTFAVAEAQPPVAGREVITLRLEASEELAAPPDVSVAGAPATVIPAGERRYLARYAATGAEGEGRARVEVSGADLAGNVGEAQAPAGTLSFDFGGPTFRDLRVDPAHVGLLAVGRRIELTFAASEELAADPLVTVGHVLNRAERVADAEGGDLRYEYTVNGTESGLVTIEGTDLRGNLGQTVLAADFDFEPPGQPRAALVRLAQNPPLSEDTVVGRPGAIYGAAHEVGVFHGAPFSDDSNLIGGWLPVGADGSFAELPIGDNTWPEVWVVARDVAGNLSAPLGPLSNDVTAPTVSLHPSNPASVRHGEAADFVVFVDEEHLDSAGLSLGGIDATGMASGGGEHHFQVRAHQGQHGVGERVVHAWAMDRAGNRDEAWAESTVLRAVSELPVGGTGRAGVAGALTLDDALVGLPVERRRSRTYRVSLERGQSIGLTATGHGLPLRLLLTEDVDPFGAVLRAGSVGPAGPLSSGLRFVSPRAATYRVVVEAAQPGALGPFTLQAAPAVQATGAFTTPAATSAGAGAAALVVTDLDGDGGLDVATGDGDAGTVSLLLGSGGGLQEALALRVGGRPVGLAAGDVNGDALVDLVAAVAEADALVVLRGLGQGTFGAAESYPTGGAPASLALGDVDGDGRLDAALALPLGDSVALLRGGPEGSFGAPEHLPLGAAPAQTEIADLDGDARPELVAVLSEDDEVGVLRGQGDGTFAALERYWAGPEPRAVAVLDAQGDGWPDLAVSNAAGAAVQLLRGRGPAGFDPALELPLPSPASDLVAADLDDDGRLDLLAAHPTEPSVSVLFARERGGFEPARVIGVPAAPERLATGDINGDGRVDLMATLPNSGQVAMLLADPGSLFAETAGVQGVDTLNQALPVELDGDGWLDLAMPGGAGEVWLMRGAGDGSFEAPRRTLVGPWLDSLMAADVDSDGWADLCVKRQERERTFLSVAYNDGRGDVLTVGTYPSVHHASFWSVADVDGDGDPDPIGSDPNGGGLYLFRGAGDGSFTRTSWLDLGRRPGPPAWGDWNVDGVLDLVSLGDGLNVVLGRGLGVMDAPLHRDLGGWQPGDELRSADLDQDGLADLVFSGRKEDWEGGGATEYAFKVLLGVGDGTFLEVEPLRLSGSPQAWDLWDANGDGVPDLLADVDRRLHVWSGLGDGSFATAIVSPPFAAHTYSLSGADFDADGRLDLVRSTVSLGRRDGVAFVWSLGAATGEEGAPGPVCVQRSHGSLALREAHLGTHIDHPRPEDLRIELIVPGALRPLGEPTPTTLVLKDAGCPGTPVTVFPDPHEPCRASDLTPLLVNLASGPWQLCVTDVDPRPGEAPHIISAALHGRTHPGVMPRAASSLAPTPGLVARYYGDAAFGAYRGLAVVPRVFEDHQQARPAALVDAQSYSIHWTGYVRVDSPGLYTFSTEVDGGVQMSVAGHLVVDALEARGEGSHDNRAAPLALGVGHHPIDLRFAYDGGAGGALRLRWAAGHLPRQPLGAPWLGH